MTYKQKRELQDFINHMLHCFSVDDISRVSGYSKLEIGRIALGLRDLSKRNSINFYDTAVRLSKPLNPASNAAISLAVRAK